MNPLKALYTIALIALGLAAAIAFFNWSTDPSCFYQCSEISLERFSLNNYYRAAQKAVAHPEAKVILVGSSRGEAAAPLMLQKIYGGTALNLSVDGADYQTKRGFVRLAQGKGQIKTLIWMADFFEALPNRTSAKMLQSKVLADFTDFPKPSGISLSFLQSLVDHNTLEASFSFLKNKQSTMEHDYGASSGVSYEDCVNDTKTPESEQTLLKEVQLIYQNYATSVLTGDPSPEYTRAMKEFYNGENLKGAKAVILIAPYHPVFKKNLQKEYPLVWQKHVEWVQSLESLRSNDVQVLNFMTEEAPFAGSPEYWDDGVHFSCHATYQMLQTSK